LGKEYTDKQVFIQSFTEKIEKTIIVSNPDSIGKFLNEIIESDIWKKI
jgi:hypothetical protein